MNTKLLLIFIGVIFTITVKSQTTISSTHTTLCSGESATLTASHDWLHQWCYWTGVQGASDYIVVSPTITTQYNVTCYDVDANQAPASFTQSVAICLGIRKELRNTVVQIYPNPTTESISIEGLEINTTVEIYNTVGELCYSSIYITEKTEINLKDYKPGIYFIKLKLGAQEFTKKVIKQ
ncbi:MAG: T9SS type A sorting domain-containing protein [Bacteroidia bacterium]